MEKPGSRAGFRGDLIGGAYRSRTDLNGFAIRCITALLTRRDETLAWKPKGESNLAFPGEYGAGNEARTRDLNLGKVALYQLSYSRVEVNAHSSVQTFSVNWRARV